MTDRLLDAAREWLRIDQDPETRAEIQQLLSSSHNQHELEKRLGSRITFGTAGLRARMEAGFSRMNSVTVIQASQGLAEYLISLDPGNREKGIVIGKDGRHNSDKFAKLTAATFSAKGFKVYWLKTVHTPLVPYGIRYHGAAAGVMVTASHNPAADNGYKVYMGNGCQIIPPHDKGIADHIEANLEPLNWNTEHINFENSSILDGYRIMGGKYLRDVKAKTWLWVPEAERVESLHWHRPIKFTYTPMHGVGWYYFRALLEIAKLDKDMHVVKSQAHRDADFPTVQFPNPEEKGAMDEAIKTADTFGDWLILANDPDADRFAAAQKVDGVWKQFTGNQMGVLLAAFVWQMYDEESSAGRSNGKRAMFVSAVSSRMLFKMGEAYAMAGDFTVEETLTGFKWLGNRAQEWEQETGGKALFAYEEAIGYMIPGVGYDKDGVAAASLFLAACYEWQKTEQRTPWEVLQDLYKTYGYFEDANTYLITPSPSVTEQVFAQIRAAAPSMVGSRSIKRWRDLTLGHDTGTPDNVPNLPVDATAQMITCWLDDDVVFTARGSGTEPKLKLYIEASSDSSERAKQVANSVLEDLMREWFKPEENGLTRPWM
ncbi:hypothetical protein MBLNU457_7542t1 [Dothideomycetes sp. NU457]